MESSVFQRKLRQHGRARSSSLGYLLTQTTPSAGPEPRARTISEESQQSCCPDRVWGSPLVPARVCSKDSSCCSAGTGVSNIPSRPPMSLSGVPWCGHAYLDNLRDEHQSRDVSVTCRSNYLHPDRKTAPHMTTPDSDGKTLPHMTTLDSDGKTAPHMTTLDSDGKTAPHMATLDLDGKTAPNMTTLDSWSSAYRRSGDTLQTCWSGHLTCSSSRHSDPLLSGTLSARFLNLRRSASRQCGLPVCDCQGFTRPDDVTALNSAEIANCPKNSARQENASVLALDGDTRVSSTNWKHRKVSEMEDLYGRPPGRSGAFYGPDSWSSSTPDLHGCGDVGVDDVDLLPASQDRHRSSSFDNHHDSQCDPGGSVQKPSDRTKTFSNVLPEHPLLGAPTHTCHGVPLPRKYSMDSQTLSESKVEVSRPASKRTIKISSPGHVSTMYISGVDTLGGLPDSDDLHHRRSYDIHFPTSSTSGSHQPDSRSMRGRRASCPVIFEIEESGDYSSSASFESQEQNVDLYSSNASHSSSEELEPHQSSCEPKLRGTFFLGSAPLKAPEKMKKPSSGQMMAGVTNIVEKQDTKVSNDGKGSSKEFLMDSSIYQQPKNVKQRGPVKHGNSLSAADKLDTTDTSKNEKTVRASGSRAASSSGSRPTSGRSSPSSGQVKAGREALTMSVTRSSSSSSSLSDVAHRTRSLSRKSSATSSADESNP